MSELALYLGFSEEVGRRPYDSLDRLISVNDEPRAMTSQGYDARGNRTSQVNGEGHETVIQSDALDHPFSFEMPEERTVARTYDAAGNVRSQTSGRGHTTN